MRNTNIITHRLSQVLETLMRQKGLTDAELAKKTNLPTSSITKLRLRYSLNPTIETLIPLSEFFGIDVEQLLGRKAVDGLELTTKKKTMESYEIPIIEIAEIPDWLTHQLNVNREGQKYTVTGIPVSEKAFALTVKGSMITPIFQENAILIFDKINDKAKIEDCSYVAVILEKKQKKSIATQTNQSTLNHLPTIKQIRFDGDDMFLSPFNPSLGGLLTNPKCSLLAIMRQVQITL
jgi:transcriptional regulator with XRE-family HTH domain